MGERWRVGGGCSVHMPLEVCLFVARLLFKHRTYEMQKRSESYFNLLMFAQLIRNSFETCGLIKSNWELFSLFGVRVSQWEHGIESVDGNRLDLELRTNALCWHCTSRKTGARLHNSCTPLFLVSQFVKMSLPLKWELSVRKWMSARHFDPDRGGNDCCVTKICEGHRGISHKFSHESTFVHVWRHTCGGKIN